MAEPRSPSPLSQSIGSSIGRLRRRGRTTLRAVLRAAEAPAELPGLQGDALVRHHLGLALDALRGPGTSKSEAFGKLRLLIDKLEQSGDPGEDSVPARSTDPSSARSRRARLLHRTFEGSGGLADWRSELAEESKE